MKDIKDYLHLYLGCEVLWEIEHESASEGGTEILDGHLVETAKAGLRIVKPVLRHLSDMIEEDCNLLGWDYKYQGKIISHRAENLFPEEVRILLKQGFDLFGLIEAGLALDKTKYLKSNCDHEYMPTTFGLRCRKCLIKLK